MSLNKPSEEHKATIRRHYVESVSTGVTPEQVHRELHDEVFSEIGKYSMQQITATTSWVASQILNEKRVGDIVWHEGEDGTNEDADFNNPEKNAARDWQIQQLLAHTGLSTRAQMSYLLLPGKNEYDYKAFTDAGLKGENFLTYILGTHPKAVAQYIRNSRKYGVINRRVGEMGKIFPKESTSVQGGYIDYFGQFSPRSAQDAYLLPLDPNFFPICIGFNFKKGREHGSTKEQGARTKIANDYVDANLSSARSPFDLITLHDEGKNYEPDNSYEMKDLRDSMIFRDMFLFAGVAQQKNWIAGDLLKSSVKSLPGNKDFDDVDVIEQYLRVHNYLKNLITVMSMIDQYASEYGFRINAWLSEAAAAAGSAVINTPVVHQLAVPFSYISGESKKPFRSYFGVLETRREKYMKYMNSIEFIFALGNEFISKFTPFLKDNELTDQVKIDLNDILKVTGVGSKKRMIALRNRKPIAEISNDILLESVPELGIAAASVRSPNDSFVRNRQEDLALLEVKKRRVKQEVAMQQTIQHFLPAAVTHSSIGQIGRNDLCPCGSGLKYKKCCLKR